MPSAFQPSSLVSAISSAEAGFVSVVEHAMATNDSILLAVRMIVSGKPSRLLRSTQDGVLRDQTARRDGVASAQIQQYASSITANAEQFVLGQDVIEFLHHRQPSTYLGD